MRRPSLRLMIEQREACKVVRQHTAQADGNRLQQVAQFEVSNHGIIDFKQQPLPIPLVRELSLIGQGRLRVQRVVHRDGNLLRHLLHEVEIRVPIRHLLQAAEAHGAETAPSGRPRHGTEGLHAVLAQYRHQLGEAGFLRQIIDGQRLLMGPHPSARRFLDGHFDAGGNRAGDRCYQ